MRVRFSALLCVAYLNPVNPGSHCPARGRAPLFRECKTRPHATHKNARVCFAHGTVRSGLAGRRFLFLDVSVAQLKTTHPTAPGLKFGPSRKTCRDTRAYLLHVSKGRRAKPQGRKQRQLSEERGYIRSVLFLSWSDLTLSDSPLPDGRVNGVASVGPSGRPNSWGGSNWPNGPSTAAAAGLGKPPPGRDPKSRARSRDYLKQYAFVPVYTCRRQQTHHPTFFSLVKMPTGNILSHITAGNEPIAQSTLT
jgi:striatin 1/3/4